MDLLKQKSVFRRPGGSETGHDILQGPASKAAVNGYPYPGRGLYSYWPVDFTINNDKQGDRARAVRNLRELSKTAEECDVVLGMEVLNRYEGYILNTCEEAIDFVDEIGSSHVKIMLDTFHMNIEETNMADAIRIGRRQAGTSPSGENRTAWCREKAACHGLR